MKMDENGEKWGKMGKKIQFGLIRYKHFLCILRNG